MTPEELLEAVVRQGLAYPETYEERPWGERALKVRKKAFCFCGIGSSGVTVTCKLPMSRTDALALPHVEPTHYGMGRHGWCTARFAQPTEDDLAQIVAWLEESFRAVAPKRLAATVPAGGPPPQPVPEPPAPVAANAPAVLIVSNDPARAARAERALAHASIAAASIAVGDDVPGEPDLVVVDVGRAPADALALAGELALAYFEAPIVLAGVRDASWERRVRAEGPARARVFREPPGDADVIAAVLKQLGRTPQD